ncbi:MAG TPA: OstA-like protein [Chitinophagaceae bacterium]|nr:OstA-like protein [Chitinophagaceae bacterium]
MNYTKKFVLLLSFLLVGVVVAWAQPRTNTLPADTSNRVHILSNTRSLVFQTVDDSTRLTIVTGDVKMRQGSALFYCDSCVINSRTNVFEAWGNVHINDADTADIYSNYLRYLGNSKLAYLEGNVRLTDGKATLTTPDLEYDMETNIGTYKKGGRVVNKQSVLTSREGYYYADLKDVYFKKDVKLKDPAYNIDTDSLLYNTTSQTTRFISLTTIKDSSGRTIKTRDGFYNQQTGKAEFGQRPEIIDGKRYITGNRIAFDDSTGMYQAEGNAIVEDTAQGTTILGGLIYQNRKTDAMLATGKPLMIIKQENDSIYISADTLFSARLTDKFGIRGLLPDSISKADSVKIDSSSKTPGDSLLVIKLPGKKEEMDSLAADKTEVLARIDSSGITDSLTVQNPVEKIDSLVAADRKISEPVKPIDSMAARRNARISQRLPGRQDEPQALRKDTVKGPTVITLSENDSTNRYFEAYRNVRIFSDSLQSVCDSLFYSFQDSVFRLFKDPVVWAQNSQITGDTILLFTKNKKADKVEAFENSFLVNRIEDDVFNQIKSARMDGWFIDGNIDSVRARSFAECIYYIQDEDSAYTGINQSQSDIIDIYFEEKQLDKVVFRSQVTGTIWPIRQKSPGEMILTGFRWLEERRPKTKYEMFE